MDKARQSIRCLTFITIAAFSTGLNSARALEEATDPTLPNGWQYAGDLEQPAAPEINNHHNLVSDLDADQNEDSGIQVVRGRAPAKQTVLAPYCDCTNNGDTVIIIRDAYLYEPDAGNWRNAFSRRHSWQDWTIERVEARRKLYRSGLY